MRKRDVIDILLSVLFFGVLVLTVVDLRLLFNCMRRDGYLTNWNIVKLYVDFYSLFVSPWLSYYFATRNTNKEDK